MAQLYWNQTADLLFLISDFRVACLKTKTLDFEHVRQERLQQESQLRGIAAR